MTYGKSLSNLAEGIHKININIGMIIKNVKRSD